MGSDFLFGNGAGICLLVGNILLVELIVMLTGKKRLNFKQVHQVVKKERPTIYLGLVVSNMITVVLPWQAVISGGKIHNFASKVNLAISYLALGALLAMVLGSLLFEVRVARR